MMYRRLQHKASVFQGQNQGTWGYRHGQAIDVPKSEANILTWSY